MTKRDSGEFSTVGQLVEGFLHTLRPNCDAEMTRIWSVWNQAVGEQIAENAQPAAFKGQHLIVHVTNSPWLHQLGFLKKELTHKVNEALGKTLIKEIRFKIGPL